MASEQESTTGRKTCYYEVLEVERKCDVADIKSSYRKLALKMHPDKAHLNGLSVEEATRQFQGIQEAYMVLSDPGERAWYDSHREQILKGHDDDGPAEDPFKTRINLYRYFSSGCYDGFGAGADGFFAVYADLFTEIDVEEAEWEDLESDEDHEVMPRFGDQGSDAAVVNAFYRRWLEFSSRKAFGHADKWNPKEAPNRQVRRAMETENKKARQAAKKEFNSEVRQLVKFVQKRDPRVREQQKQQLKENVEKTKEEEKKKEQRKATEAAERKVRQEAARVADEARWAEVLADRQARRERGEIVTEDEAEEESEKEEVAFVCEPCHKTFRSEKAYDQHAKSKKHLQVIAELCRELEREAKEAKARDESSEGEDSDEDLDGMSSDSEADAKETQRKEISTSAPSSGSAQKADSASEDEEDEEDAFLARFAASKKKAVAKGSDAFAPPARGSDAVEESSSSGDEDEAEPAAPCDADPKRPAAEKRPLDGAGKRQQKKEQQRALLLERAAANKARAEAAAAEAAAEAAAKAAAAGEAAPAEGRATDAQAGAAGGEKCGVCGATFSSRSKLFQHIKASGHAMLKPAENQQEPASTFKSKAKRLQQKKWGQAS